MSSILTNNGAMVALQTLKSIKKPCSQSMIEQGFCISVDMYAYRSDISVL